MIPRITPPVFFDFLPHTQTSAAKACAGIADGLRLLDLEDGLLDIQEKLFESQRIVAEILAEIRTARE